MDLAEAQVALDHVQQEVARELTAARMALEMQQLQIQVAKARMDEAHQLNILNNLTEGKTGAEPDANQKAKTIQAKLKIAEATAALRLEVGKLSELESRLQYLAGEPASQHRDGVTGKVVAISSTGNLNIRAAPTGKERTDPMTDPSTSEMRTKLSTVAEKPITLDFVEMPLADAINYISDASGIRFVLHEPVLEEIGSDGFGTPITLSLGPTPFPAALTAVQDQVPYLRFVVRPYGVLLTAERGEPLGSMSVEEFYRQNKRAAPGVEAK